MLEAISNTPATITLTSTLNGQPASPGQEVTYTCTLTEAALISWTASPVFTSTNLVHFLSTTPSNQTMLSCSDVQSINCAELDFLATLTNVGPLDMNNQANLTSTFRFTATVELNETVINCSGVTETGAETENQTLIVKGM